MNHEMHDAEWDQYIHDLRHQPVTTIPNRTLAGAVLGGAAMWAVIGAAIYYCL